jgi:hypothetical protein
MEKLSKKNFSTAKTKQKQKLLSNPANNRKTKKRRKREAAVKYSMFLISTGLWVPLSTPAQSFADLQPLAVPVLREDAPTATTADPASPTPYIIVTEYDYGGSAIEAGTSFNMTIYFQNTSRSIPVENIIMSLETDEGISIADSSNSLYVEQIKPQETMVTTIPMKALATAGTKTASVNVTFRYEYVDGDSRQSQTISEKLSFPVIEKDRFEVTPPSAMETYTVGQETVLSFDYVNKGKGTLSNASVTVTGNMPVLSSKQQIGNIESGKSGTVDIVCTPDAAGNVEFNVKFEYENPSGQTVTLDFPFSGTVEDFSGELEGMATDGMEGMEGMEGEFFPDDSVKEGNSFWGWIFGLSAAAIAGLVIWILIKRNKKKKEEQEDDFLYDDIPEDDSSDTEDKQD